MKCVILAGGSGDRLWPLSRKKFPKQFMEIRENRSLLQETVVRNMPYCEEFFIVTNMQYQFLVESQMKAFQGLKYRCFYEEEARNTAAAITLISLLSNSSEKLLVVASDILAEGNAYRKAIIRGRELLQEGNLVVLGIPAGSAETGYGYIRCDGETVLEFKEKPDADLAKEYIARGGYLWNSGMFFICAGDFLQEMEKYSPQVLKASQTAIKGVEYREAEIFLKREWMKDIPAMSVERAVFEHSDKMKVVPADLTWYDIDCLEDVLPCLAPKAQPNVILENCENATVVNRAKRQLIVANQLKDILIVNTEDALYVADKQAASDSLKKIMQENQVPFGEYFEKNRVAYRKWGTYKVLNQGNGFKVKKVTIAPGETIFSHIHTYRSEHWSIVSGEATITLGNVTKQYHTGESIYVPMGVAHQVSNITVEELVIIEVGIGETITESDMIHLPKQPKEDSFSIQPDSISRMEPAFKDYLWGGNRLQENYGKRCDYEIVAESWELSAHEAGQSVIGEGRYKGMLFGEYLRRAGKSILGWKCQSYEEFPLLIKLIDARDALSIQVHPDDEFALLKEGEYGKNEMWYIMDCEEDASLFCGFSEALTPVQVEQSIRENTLHELLREIPVHKGDTIFIPAGTVHAIGRGILICEIQQNSNSTYRMYDYGRRDKYGNLRELHLDKAMQVADFSGKQIHTAQHEVVDTGRGYHQQLLGQCKYFEASRVIVEHKASLPVDDLSFLAVVVLEGDGRILVEEKSLAYHRGDSFFIPAGRKSITIEGACEFIIVQV